MTPFKNGSNKLIARDESMRDTRVRRESAGFVMEGIVDGGSRRFASAGDFEGSAFRYGGGRELGRGDGDDSVEGSGAPSGTEGMLTSDAVEPVRISLAAAMEVVMCDPSVSHVSGSCPTERLSSSSCFLLSSHLILSRSAF